MAESRMVVDEERPVPKIDYVYTLSKTEVVEEPVDPFSVSGEEIRALNGTRPNVKRKITTELKKYNRSADKTVSSKQIEDLSEISGYDAFQVVTPPHSMDALIGVYELSSAHYAAVNAKVDNIVGLGYKLVETAKTKRGLEELADKKTKIKRVRADLELHREELYEQIEDLNEEDTFTETLKKVWRDYEVTGNGYIEVGRTPTGGIGYVGHIPSRNVRIRRSRDGFVQISGNNVTFFRNFGDKDFANPIGDDQNPNEILHIKKYAPSSSYYGVPDIVAAQQAVAGSEMVARFNLEFFENKAVPRHLITLKGGHLGPSAQSDLLAFFETGLKGQNHRSMFIPLPADAGENKVEFKIEAIDTKVQEGSFDKYDKSNQAKILMAHRVPISKVNTAESASLAIAKDADKTFKEQVCSPEQKVMEKKVNRVVKEMSDGYQIKLNEMTLTDENTQSQIYERYRKTGVLTGNEVRIKLGEPTIEGGDELFDMNAKAKTGTETGVSRERDAVRSANQTDSAGEARNPKGDGRTTP